MSDDEMIDVPEGCVAVTRQIWGMHLSEFIARCKAEGIDHGEALRWGKRRGWFRIVKAGEIGEGEEK